MEFTSSLMKITDSKNTLKLYVIIYLYSAKRVDNSTTNNNNNNNNSNNNNNNNNDNNNSNNNSNNSNNSNS